MGIQSETNTILIADDNPENLSLAREILRGAGYRVLVALDGEAVLKSLNLEKPDLILLDVHMPKMDGYETCKKIKSDPALSDIPVLFLSAINEVFNKIQAFKIGAVDYISKPFNNSELLIRISTHLELNKARIQIQRDAEALRAAFTDLKETSKLLIETEKKTVFSDLGAGLAHELNNPLNFIVLGTEALIRDFKDLRQGIDEYKDATVSDFLKDASLKVVMEEIPRLLEGLKIGSERSSRILKSLDTLKPVNNIKEEWDLSELLDRVVNSKVEEFPGITINRTYSAKPRVSCYEEKLIMLFHYLLDNAFDAVAGSATPVVTLALEALEGPSGKWACITISDNGRGIPKELRSRIFEPFFTTKEIGKGAGLGLSIAQGIAAEHKGTLELLDGIGPGATFRILLPL